MSDTADLVLRNGTIATANPALPRAEALAVRGETIAAVGSEAEIAPLAGPSTKVIDLEGGLAVPGFIEGHGHFLGLGQALTQLDLRPARCWDDAVAMVADAARSARPGQWLLGRGWHQDKWDEAPSPCVEGLPLHDALSAAAPRNPVLLRHACGHSLLANALAMEAAEVTPRTPDPPGGRILRDASGCPTGAFLEAAMDIVAKAHRRLLDARTPREKEAERRRLVDLTTRTCLANGITTFHDAGASFESIALYRKLAVNGELGLRLWVMMGEGDEAIRQRLPAARCVGHGAGRLTVRAIKRFADGAFGSRTAWMLEPYTGRGDDAGIPCSGLHDLADTALLAIENDLQLCVHAIGDRANREVLDIFAAAFQAHPHKTDLRWRIEHAQHLHPDDVPRFARLGVVAAMQGSHCTCDGPALPAALGEHRATQRAYVWQSLLKAGAVVINGTDAPVEDVSPITSFHASVSRRMADGSVFAPEQRMTRWQALCSYTLAAAYAGFEEQAKGSLEPGKLADIAVLSRDILTVPEEEIPATEVLLTILGGRIAFSR